MLILSHSRVLSRKEATRQVERLLTAYWPNQQERVDSLKKVISSLRSDYGILYSAFNEGDNYAHPGDFLSSDSDNEEKKEPVVRDISILGQVSPHITDPEFCISVEEETAEGKELLEREKAVHIVGIRGSGKTHLAYKIAKEINCRFKLWLSLEKGLSE